MIDHGISAPQHGRNVVDGLNDKEKNFIFYFMATVQLNAIQRFDTKTIIHTPT